MIKLQFLIKLLSAPAKNDNRVVLLQTDRASALPEMSAAVSFLQLLIVKAVTITVVKIKFHIYFFWCTQSYYCHHR